MIPARTSRARTSESRTAQLSKERRRFGDVDIDTCSKNTLGATEIAVVGNSIFREKARRDQRQQQPRVWRVADGSRNFITCDCCITSAGKFISNS
jgi:hypothetical protein